MNNMALSREQFDELRKKGLTPAQIADFERGNKPASQAQQKDRVTMSKGFESGAKGFAKGVGSAGFSDCA